MPVDSSRAFLFTSGISQFFDIASMTQKSCCNNTRAHVAIFVWDERRQQVEAPLGEDILRVEQ